MKEVARVADVSLATVSRVVNGSGDVRADLAERVHEAVEAARLPARPDGQHAAPRRPAVGQHRADHRGRLEPVLLRRAPRRRGRRPPARRAHLRRLLRRGARARARARRGVRRPRRRRAGDRPCATDQSYLLREHQAGTALVFVDRPPRFMHGDAVVSDNAGGARAAVEHLIAAGPPPDRLPRRPPVGLHRHRAPRAATTRRSPRPGSSARRARAHRARRQRRAERGDVRAAGAAPTRRRRCSPART